MILFIVLFDKEQNVIKIAIVKIMHIIFIEFKIFNN